MLNCGKAIARKDLRKVVKGRKVEREKEQEGKKDRGVKAFS